MHLIQFRMWLRLRRHSWGSLQRYPRPPSWWGGGFAAPSPRTLRPLSALRALSSGPLGRAFPLFLFYETTTAVHTDTEPGSDDAEIRSPPAAPAKPHKWKPMVPRSFDGTECFTNWWNHIENVIEYNGWTEHETMLQLRNLLLGDAAHRRRL